MRFSMVRTALAVLVGAAAISSCSENPISAVKPVEAPTQQLSVVAAPSVVISQIYGAGGNSGAVFTNDYVELFNASSAPVTVTGWKIHYASSTGVTWNNTFVLPAARRWLGDGRTGPEWSELLALASVQHGRHVYGDGRRVG